MTFIVAQLPGNAQLCQRGFPLSFKGRPSKIELRPSVVSWTFLYMEPPKHGIWRFPKFDAPRGRPDLEATHLLDGMFGSPVAQDSGPSVREKLAESCLMLPFYLCKAESDCWILRSDVASFLGRWKSLGSGILEVHGNKFRHGEAARIRCIGKSQSELSGLELKIKQGHPHW